MNELKSPNDKLKNVHKLENIVHSDKILFVCLGPVQMCLCTAYEHYH